MNAATGLSMRRDACCAVASNSLSEATLVRSLLEGEFAQILTVTSDEEWARFAAQDNVAVLLLAFSKAAASLEFQDRYLLHRQSHPGHPAQVVLLCTSDEVGEAYTQCRLHGIFDYVMFWPVTHDPKRLPLVAHRACDAYEKLQRDDPPATPTEIASQTLKSTVAVQPEPAPVLVVDDDRFQLDLVISVLRSVALPAMGVASASAAFDLLEKQASGLILLDVNMPDLDGVTMLRRLKSAPRLAGIPVIMLTAMRNRELVMETLREGAVDYIAKPYDRDTLLKKVRRALHPGVHQLPP